MKKIFSWMWFFSLILSMSGCGQNQKPVNEISIWHWMTDRQIPLEMLAEKYEDQTGISVKLELFAPSDAYTQKIIAAAQARVLPDIYSILDKKRIVASFVKAGFVADLTEEFQADDSEWEKRFFSEALDVNRFFNNNPNGIKPGIYGVPIDVMSIQLLYNKDLLRRAGFNNPPRTFVEFLSQIIVLKRIGVTPFVSGFGEMWFVDCFASAYAFNIMGEKKVMDTFRGKVPYTDSQWIEVFGIFETLRQNGAFIDGIVTKGNKYAEQDFALGRAAFAFNGSWCVNVYHDMNSNLDYGVTSLPVINPGLPMRSWGGAGSSFVVNNTSANKDKAIAFLKWLTEKDQQSFLAEQTRNLPANRNAVIFVSDVLSGFVETLEHVTHPFVWELNEEPLVIEAFDKGIQAIIIGEKTPQEIAQQVQKVKERQMQKLRR